MSILKKIILHKKKEVENDKVQLPINELKKKIAQKIKFFSKIAHI